MTLSISEFVGVDGLNIGNVMNTVNKNRHNFQKIEFGRF